MDTNMNWINEYETSWFEFQRQCEQKIKGRCILNNTCWRKLKEWHIQEFTKKLDNPRSFFIHLKWKRPDIFHSVMGIYSLYRTHAWVQPMNYDMSKRN